MHSSKNCWHYVSGMVICYRCCTSWQHPWHGSQYDENLEVRRRKVHRILCREKFIKVYFMWRNVHGILCREKFISCGKTYLWSMVVSPWNLNLWILDHGISTDVLIPSIELMVLVCYGFGPWYWSMI